MPKIAPIMSVEQRQIAVEKSKETRLRKKEALTHGPITSWEDRDLDGWKEMAKQKGVTMPPRRTALSVPEMKHYLRQLKITLKQYQDWAGDTLEKFIFNNPTWSLRAWLGIVMERYYEV